AWTSPEAGPEEITPDHLHILLSPMTGTFYRSESPDTPPLIEPGMHVEEGQTVGILEAMKVFSHIPADREGIVVEIRARNG
ncbi:acetyl-CoA carboxylase biotin carboxyl carrier protein, partial [Escherichia coli]